MPDELSIYNAALLEIGQTPLTSVDDASSAGVQCRAHYADARDATLELHPWNFATTYATLARSGTTPAMRWKYQYALPTGAGLGQPPYCLVVRETDKGAGTRWDIGSDKNDGRVLFSNEPNLAIGYTARIEDLGQWSRIAIQVLIKLLASKLAKPLTGQLDVEQAKLKEALGLVPAGAGRDAGETGGSDLQVITSADTTLALANEVLSELGLAAIADLQEQTVLAQHLRIQFAGARDTTLEFVPWHFATVYAALKASTRTPPFRWQHQYLLPESPHCLIVRTTDKGVGTRWELGYDQVDGRVLYSNETTVSIEYTGRILDLPLWDTLARQVLVKVFASKVAQALVQTPLPAGQQPANDLETLGKAKWEQALQLLPAGLQSDQRQGGGAQYQVIDSADTTLALANEVLSELGLAAIADLQEQTVLAQHLRTQYDDARDTTLTLSPWPFARFQAALTASTVVPPFKWAAQYRLPTNPYCLTVLGTDQGARALYEIGQHPTDGRVLFSNATSVKIEYLGRVSDLTHWNPLARQVLVKVWASKVAQALASQAVGPQDEASGQAAFVSLARTKWDEALSLVPVALHRHRSEQQPVAYRLNNEATTATATQLAQRALSELGEEPLADINELSVVGWHCRLQLPSARDATLELHPWNFAKRQAALAVSTTVPAFKWSKQYRLPASCLTVLGTDGGNGAKWEIGNDVTNGRVLLSNESAVSIEYIFQQADYTTWSALALDVLVKVLASKLAPALARELLKVLDDLPPEMGAGLREEARVLLGLGNRKHEEALLVLRDARDRDAREGYPVVLTPNRTLVSVRGGGSRLGSIWEAADA